MKKPNEYDLAFLEWFNAHGWQIREHFGTVNVWVNGESVCPFKVTKGMVERLFDAGLIGLGFDKRASIWTSIYTRLAILFLTLSLCLSTFAQTLPLVDTNFNALPHQSAGALPSGNRVGKTVWDADDSDLRLITTSRQGGRAVDTEARLTSPKKPLARVETEAARGHLYLIDRIALLESGNDSSAIGDNGRSLGKWQMSESAFIDVCAIRRDQGLPVYDWEMLLTDEGIAREHALQFLGLQKRRLTNALKRCPTDAELICVWSLGFEGFKRRGFLLSNCPVWLQRKAKDL